MFAGFAEIMHPDDVRMAESSQGAGFTGEPFGERGIAAPLRRQNFDGHEAVELELPRLVDGAHAALTEQRKDFQLGEVGSQVGRVGRDERAVIAGWRR